MANIYQYKDYMDGKVTFQQFNLAIAKAAGIDRAFKNNPKVAEFVKAMQAGDATFTKIGLAYFDGFEYAFRASVALALKNAGTIYSLSLLVCAVKAAARDAALQMMGEEAAAEYLLQNEGK